MTLLLCAVPVSIGVDRLYEQLEMLEMSELLWSLCEILLIDIAPGLSRCYTTVFADVVFVCCDGVA